MITPKPNAQAESIATQLDQAEQKLAELRAAEPRLAHDAALGVEGARAHYEEAHRTIADTEADVELLTKALAHAQQSADRKAAARKRGEQAAIRERALKSARQRVAMFEELSATIAKAISLKNKINESCANLRASLPLPEPLPIGLLVNEAEVRQLINNEIIRFDGIQIQDRSDIHRTFPRVATGHFLPVNPATIQPMADAVAASITMLDGELLKIALASAASPGADAPLAVTAVVPVAASGPLQTSDADLPAEHQ